MSAMSVPRVGPALLFALALAGRSVFSLSQTPAPAPSPSSPVTYTEEQAARGADVFSQVCVECHVRKDMSNANFRVKWNGRPAFDLFEIIRSTMPEGSPGSLDRPSYLDVVAYIAKVNGIEAGTTALPDDEAVLKKQLLALPPTAP